ncbi:MAG: PIN domain nuclease [Anaerolineaceae bacterium]|nr:PIN domain nuclease [Anaerolineaceae bacterium]
MTDAIFLDANIFMYAAGATHQYKAPCLQILALVETKKLTAVTSSEVLQELLYRYSHLQLAEKGIHLCRRILDFPMQILPVTAADVQRATEILEASPGIKSRDAIHAATMLNNNVEEILTADKHFEQILSLNRLDPHAYVASIS